MALGTLKCDTIENDGSQSITVANLVNLDTNKANLSGATFTGDVTLNAQQELRLADSDSSNYIAFASPATVGTNSTWSMPSDAPVAGDVLTVTSVSSNNPALEWAPAVGGKVLQVVQTVKTDQFTTISTSPVAVTGLSASITPTTSGNKILVEYNISTATNSSAYTTFAYLYKNGSVISDAIGAAEGVRTRCTTSSRFATNTHISAESFTFLDTTSGTSAITYQVYFSAESGITARIGRIGATTDAVNIGVMPSSITLTEIAQ